MVRTGVEITGDKALDKLLREMTDNIRDKHLKAASAAVIRYIVQPKVKAAIGGGGKIKRHKGVLSERGRLKNYAPRKRKDWPVSWKLKLSAPHAQLLEFGTKDRMVPKAVAHPSKKNPSGWGFGRWRGRIQHDKFAFLRKALYGSEREARQAFIKAIRAFIREQSTKAKFAKKAIKG